MVFGPSASIGGGISVMCGLRYHVMPMASEDEKSLFHPRLS